MPTASWSMPNQKKVRAMSLYLVAGQAGMGYGNGEQEGSREPEDEEYRGE